MTLKNTYPRGKTIIYQRAVRTKLRDRYEGRSVKHDLKTNDLTVAAKAVALLNKSYDVITSTIGGHTAPVVMNRHTAKLTPASI